MTIFKDKMINIKNIYEENAWEVILWMSLIAQHTIPLPNGTKTITWNQGLHWMFSK